MKYLDIYGIELEGSRNTQESLKCHMGKAKIIPREYTNCWQFACDYQILHLFLTKKCILRVNVCKNQTKSGKSRPRSKIDFARFLCAVSLKCVMKWNEMGLVFENILFHGHRLDPKCQNLTCFKRKITRFSGSPYSDTKTKFKPF